MINKEISSDEINHDPKKFSQRSFCLLHCTPSPNTVKFYVVLYLHTVRMFYILLPYH